MRSTPPPFPFSFFHKSTPISFSSPPNYTHFVSHFPFFTRLLTWSPICSSLFSFFSDMLSVFPARYSAVSGGRWWLEVGSWFSLILQANTPFQLHFSLIFFFSFLDVKLGQPPSMADFRRTVLRPAAASPSSLIIELCKHFLHFSYLSFCYLSRLGLGFESIFRKSSNIRRNWLF